MASEKLPNASDAPRSDCSAETGVVECPPSGMKRDLSRRHLNMIGLAGMIGTGLFLASGSAIATAGPIGALLGYIFMSFLTASVALTIGELTSFMPVTGGFVRHAARFIQPAMGAATGWNYWYMLSITGPAELSAAATLINFWNPYISAAVWYTVFIVLIALVSFFGIRVYGECEVVFSSIKILLIVGLILAGIIVDCGGSPSGEYIGFKYWVDPGPFNTYHADGDTGRFLAFFSTLISAAYAFCNIQVTALTASETKNPRKVIPDAMKMTFWRIIVFYVISMLVVGLLVPYNDSALGNSSGTAQQSPFVIAFQKAGIKTLPSVINAALITSAFSCGLAVTFLASRVLYGLAEEGQAPKFFLRTNRFGSPYIAVAVSIAFLPLAYLSIGSNASVAFGWFVNIASIAALISWVIIEVSFLRFFYAMKAQGLDRNRLIYKSPFQPYMAWVTTLFLVIVTLFSGYTVFLSGNWDTQTFLTSYIDIPIFLLLWGVSWYFFRSKVIPLDCIDLSEFDDIQREKELEHDEENLPWYRVLG